MKRVLSPFHCRSDYLKNTLSRRSCKRLFGGALSNNRASLVD